MNKTILAVVSTALLSTATFADVSITGAYEGTISNQTGASTFSDDLDLTIKGKSGDTTVTATIENLTGGAALKTKQVYIDTKLEGIKFRGGTYKSLNGNGLLQKKTNGNKMRLSTKMSGVNLDVTQPSGDGNTKVGASFNLNGVSIKAQDLTNDTRFISAAADLKGVSLAFETQEASTGKTNSAYSVGGTVGPASVTYVNIDVQDASGVTQDDGILGDISGATADKDLYGVVASLGTDAGKLTGKYISKNDKDIYVGKLERGNWAFTATDTEGDDDLAYKAEVSVKF